MIILVPKWAFDYPEFWNTIRRRNLWFIRLRYLAALSIFAFLLFGEYLLSFNLEKVQIFALLTISFSILAYNVAIDLVRPKIGITPGVFNAMHLSLIQMLLDLTALMLVIYFTGMVESPLYTFFIFHMVIGSMILPGYLIKTICLAVIGIYSLLALLQRLDIIETHLIPGVMTLVTKPWTYDVLFLFTFSAMMLITVFITNRISKNLLQREEQLRQTLIKLDEAEKSKQKYLMGVVHEIKSPISAIESIVDLVLEKYLGPVSVEVEEKLFRIKKRAEEGIYLINSILKISKLKLLETAEKKEINIDELITEFLNDTSDKIKSKHFSINFTDLRDDRKDILGDEELIRLAISNILSNSEKYVREYGTIEIIVTEESGKLVLEITDNGIGIPEKDLPKIFDQFHRGSNTKKFKLEGSGLGLSLVKEIIVFHGGTIEVQSPSRLGSTENPGATFFIKLPYSVKQNQDGPKLHPLKGGL